MKKILIGMFACMLLLTGCSSNDEEENIDKNTGKKQLVVAMDTASAPYNYLATGQNEYTVAFGKELYASGYDVLVARDLAKALKKELVIKKMSSAKFAEALDAGEVDIVISGVLKNNKEESLTYSSAYAKSSVAILVRKGDKSAAYRDIKQFKNVKIAGQSGMMSDNVIDQIKGVKHQKALENNAALVKALKDKKVDAISVDKATADIIVSQNSDLAVVALEKGFKDAENIVMAMEEGSEDSGLYKKVEAFIKKLTKEKKQDYMDIARKNAPAILK